MEPRKPKILEITLSPTLYAQLAAEALRLGLPLAYLVAGLVVDTLEVPAAVRPAAPPPLRATA